MKKGILFIAFTFALALGSIIRAQVYISDAYNNGSQAYDFSNSETVTTYAPSGVGYVAGNGGQFYHWGPAVGTLIVNGVYNAWNPAVPGFTVVPTNPGLDYFQGPDGAKSTAQEIGGNTAPRFGILKLDNGPNQINITNSGGVEVGRRADFTNGITTTIRGNTSAGALRFLANTGYTGSVNSSFSFSNAAADAQHVDGYVGKAGNEGFVYPVGSATDARPFQLGGGGSATQEFDVAWIVGNPTTTADPSDPAGAQLHPITSVGPGVAAVSPVGQWDFIQAQGTGNGAGLGVTVSIPDVTDFSLAGNLILVGWDGTKWVNLSAAVGLPPYATGTAENSTLAGTMQAGITAVGIGTVNTVLPVVLQSFTAVSNGCSVNLAWASAAEQNNKSYIVEYSTDGASFTTIGEIASRNSPTGAAYSYTYSGAQNGAGFYRLRMVDRDGSEKYSATLTLTITCNSTIVIAPNPVTTQFTVRGLTIGSNIEIYNGAGILLSTTKVTGSIKTINAASYPAGVYLVRIMHNGMLVTTAKLSKQ